MYHFYLAVVAFFSVGWISGYYLMKLWFNTFEKLNNIRIELEKNRETCKVEDVPIIDRCISQIEDHLIRYYPTRYVDEKKILCNNKDD